MQQKPEDDPFRDREAAKYEHPIPSREFVLECLRRRQAPASFDQLASELGLTGDLSLEALRRRLRAMVRDGQLLQNRRDAFLPVNKADLTHARVEASRDGYGFAVPSHGGDDLYLSGREMRKVFHGDAVLVRCIGQDRRGRPEAAIVEVVDRAVEQVVGRYEAEDGVGWVRADNPRLQHPVLVATEDRPASLQSGDYVTVAVSRQPEVRRPPQGRVIEVLGPHLSPGMEIEVALRSHGIPHAWPEAVTQTAQTIPSVVSADEANRRVDLRQLPFVTIDGEDARDFDDAVYCEGGPRGGHRLWVAIADVSHYVGVDSALDDEARLRGTSVYFPGRVVPMLPEALSNGICSLNPEVDRLALICEVHISRSGAIRDFEFYEGVIHSQARLTYTQVAAALAPENPSVETLSPEVQSALQRLHQLYEALCSARMSRGALDFDTVETRFEFGPSLKVERVVPTERNVAHRMIEEAMLAANVCAARFLEHHQVPALYRVHEPPTPDRLEALQEFLGGLGLSLGRRGRTTLSAKVMQGFLDQVAERPDRRMIQMVVLRSLRQARYTPENQGHFGLGYDGYTHFTSPIRRYPDLLVHRAIRSVVRSRKPREHLRRVRGAGVVARKQIYPYRERDLVELGDQCSAAERRADIATRDVEEWLKCEFISDRVGDTFDGIVVAVTGFGLFVELKDLFVEGLVHISALGDDYYRHEPTRHRLVGERTGQVYRLTDPLQVRVLRVDLDARSIDLEPVAVGRDRKQRPTQRKRRDRRAGRNR